MTAGVTQAPRTRLRSRLAALGLGWVMGLAPVAAQHATGETVQVEVGEPAPAMPFPQSTEPADLQALCARAVHVGWLPEDRTLRCTLMLEDDQGHRVVRIDGRSMSLIVFGHEEAGQLSVGGWLGFPHGSPAEVREPSVRFAPELSARRRHVFVLRQRYRGGESDLPYIHTQTAVVCLEATYRLGPQTAWHCPLIVPFTSEADGEPRDTATVSFIGGAVHLRRTQGSWASLWALIAPEWPHSARRLDRDRYVHGNMARIPLWPE